MADLEPAPARQAVIDRGSLLVEREWLRWLDQVRTRLLVLGQSLSDLEAAVAGLVQPQVTTLTVAVSGAAVLTFAALAPAGSTVIGVTWRISTAFSAGPTGLVVGDVVANDRWGVAAAVTLGTSGDSSAWRGQGGFAVPSAYTVLVAPTGGGFGSAGAVTCRCAWWPALAAP